MNIYLSGLLHRWIGFGESNVAEESDSLLVIDLGFLAELGELPKIAGLNNGL